MTDPIREESIRVLEWGASIYRKGRPAHDELSGLAERLRDPSVDLVPTSGTADETVRRHLLVLKETAYALARILPDARVTTRPVDAAFAERILSESQAGLDRMSRDVTYGEVMRRLSGSWGDSDMGNAISALARRMDEAATPALEPEASESPSP